MAPTTATTPAPATSAWRSSKHSNNASNDDAADSYARTMRLSSTHKLQQQHNNHTSSHIKLLQSNQHGINAIDLSDSDDDDYVASDYQSSDRTPSARHSITLISNDGDVVQEDALYIIHSSYSRSSRRQHASASTSTSSASHHSTFEPPFFATNAPTQRHQRHQQHKRRHTTQYLLDRLSDAPNEDRKSTDDNDATSTTTNSTTLHLFSRKHIGLLVSLAFASMLTSILKRGVLPLMQAEIAMAPYQVDATKILLMLPWSLSLLVGFVSDVLPIRGSHRRAYMVIGWCLTALALGAMALLNNSFNRQDTGTNDTAQLGSSVVATYMALLGVACFGGIASVVVAEIFVVALSQREVLKRRGVAVGTFLLVQFGFEGVGQVVTDAVVFQQSRSRSNSSSNSNALAPIVSLQTVLLVLVGYAVVPIVALVVSFDDRLESTGGRIGECLLLENDDDKDDADDDASSYQAPRSPTATQSVIARAKRHWLLLWHTLAQQATWHVVCFLCLFIFFMEFTLKYPFTVLDKWANVTPKMTSSSKIAVEVMYFAAALAWRVRLRRMNWNTVVVSSYLGVFVFPCMTYYLVVTFTGSSSSRSNVGGGSVGPIGLFMLVSALHGFIRGLAIVLEVAMTVEIAREGAEGALLGAIVSIGSIIRLVSETFSNMIGWLFGTQFLTADNHDKSAPDEPMLVATALLLCFTLRLFALVGVLFLPSQKLALLRLRFVGSTHVARAYATLAILVASMLTSSIVNTLVITPDTMCLPAFGGKGCSN